MDYAEIDKFSEEMSRISSVDNSLSLSRLVASSIETQLLATLSASSTKQHSLEELHNLIRGWGDRMLADVRAASCRTTGFTSFGTAETIVRNVLLRLLRILRVEALLAGSDGQFFTSDSLMDEPIHRLLTGSALSTVGEKQNAPPTANLIEAFTEYGFELDSLRDSLESRAVEFAASDISASSQMLVLGRSRSTAAFLRAFHKLHSKKFPGARLSFLVAETGVFTNQQCQDCSDANAFVGDLKHFGIQNVSLVEDHSWYSLLVPRGHTPSAIRMVVISALAVLADGSCLAPPGAWFVALAAHRGALPVIVVAAQYKLTPAFTIANAPPRFDVISSELVNFIVTDIGTFSPAAIAKAMSELYGLPDASTCFSS